MRIDWPAVFETAGNSRRRPLARALGEACLVAVAAALVLAVVARPIDLSRIHLGLLSFNDQVGYISVARNLLDNHVLQSSIIYPATLLQDATRNYFYMPGHYLVLAATYWLLGVGAWQALLPNELAYIVAAAATYLLARHFYDWRAGLLAAALFMFFPPNVVYALSAMSDMTRVAATVGAFAVFVALPRRWQILLGPWLVVVPFLFRETGALLIAPMALLLAQGRPWRAQGPTVMFVLYAVVVVALVYRADFSAGRPTLLPVYVFDDRPTVMHRDAIAQQLTLAHPLMDWLTQLPRHMWENARSLKQAFRNDVLAFAAVWSWGELVVAGLVAVAALLKRKAGFLWLVTALTALHVLFLLALYDAFGFGWLRMLQTLTPFLAIAAGAGLAWAWRWLAQQRAVLGHTATAAVLAVAALGSLVAVRDFFEPATALQHEADAHTAWLEAIGHDDSKMLVSGVDFLDYAYEHHPVEWSFLPANGATLRLLAARYRIGTMIVPKDRLEAMFQPDDLAAAGLHLDKTVGLDGTDYLIYRDTAPDAAPN